jgi:hypothetical protein
MSSGFGTAPFGLLFEQDVERLVECSLLPRFFEDRRCVERVLVRRHVTHDEERPIRIVGHDFF